MGRGEPTYDLQQLQQLIGQGSLSCVISQAAYDGAKAVDLHEDDIVAAVLELTASHFYKSMEAEQRRGLWQDVYHLEYRGVWLYIKLQFHPDGRAIVIQFKRK